MAKTSSRFRISNKASCCGSVALSRKRFSRTNDKIFSKILLEIIPIDYHDRRDLQRKPFLSLVRKSVDKAKSSPHLPIKANIDTPLPSPKIFNPSNHMTRRAIKISSNQKRRSKADGMKVRFPTVLTRGFLFSALSASCQ